MKIILIEDDPLIQIELRLLLLELGHEVVGEFDRYEEVENRLEEFESVDLAFIDIQLASSYDGIDVAELLQNRHKMNLVFLTSNVDDRVLSKSNRLKIADFLAKPFRTEDIKICLARLPLVNTIPIINELFLKDGHTFFKLTIDEFLWAKAEDNYITIKTAKEKRLIMLPLKDFILKFSNPNVFRVHRSYVINILKIDQIQSTELKIGQEIIPISESYKEVLFESLNISLN
jgi:DNA-binding LytR/AlgR family response regulator